MERARIGEANEPRNFRDRRLWTREVTNRKLATRLVEQRLIRRALGSESALEISWTHRECASDTGDRRRFALESLDDGRRHA